MDFAIRCSIAISLRTGAISYIRHANASCMGSDRSKAKHRKRKHPVDSAEDAEDTEPGVEPTDAVEEPEDAAFME